MSAALAATDAAWQPRGNRWLIAVVVTLAAFMEVLDTTIVNVSLPHIAGSLSVSYDDATWTLTSYLVANGIVLPISGWLGRLLGRKRYFLICIAMFTVCSFLCGIADSLGQMVVFRLLQGFFGGGLQPNQQSIILDTFPPAQRGRAFAVVALATIVAPVIGPTLGGWITDSYSWRWVFLINIPVGVLAFFAVTALVEDPPWVVRASQGRQHTDYIGLGLIALGLGAMQLMLDRGEDQDWFSSGFVLGCAILAGVGLSTAIAWLLYTDRPMVNLRVFKDRNFAIGAVMIFGVGAVLYSSAVLIPQLAQETLGYTALLAGLLLSPGALMIIFLIPLVGKFLMPNVQTRLIIAFGFASLGVALDVASRVLTPDVDFVTLALLRAGQTFGLAFLFVPISTIAYSTMPKELNGDASALFVMFRNIGGSIGISLAAAMVTQRTQVRRAYLSEHLTPLNQPYDAKLAQLAQSIRDLGVAPGDVHARALGQMNAMLSHQANLQAYLDVFAMCAFGAACMVPLAFLFRASKAGGGKPGPTH
jgi:DHA2 family multidrug resistance protein